MIKSNKQLRSLGIQKVALNDSQAGMLVQPIVDSMNLEILKFDYNNIGGDFLENLCATMISNPL